jgi:hypothetical protein
MARPLRWLVVLLVAGLVCVSTAAARTVHCRSTKPVYELTTNLLVGLPGEYAAPHKLLPGCQVAKTLSSGIYQSLHARKKPAPQIILRNTPSPGEPGHQAYVFIPYLVSHATTDTITGTIFCLTHPSWYIRFTIRGPNAPPLVKPAAVI